MRQRIRWGWIRLSRWTASRAYVVVNFLVTFGLRNAENGRRELTARVIDLDLVTGPIRITVVENDHFKPPLVENQGDLRRLERDPPVEVIDGAVYLPPAMLSIPGYTGTSQAVIYSNLLQPIESTIGRQGGLGNLIPYVDRPTLTETPEYFSNSAIFVGAFHRDFHYGHFLTEGIVRLWYLSQESGTQPLVYLGPDLELLPRYATDFFNAIGISDRLINFSRPTIIERLTIPSASMVYATKIHSIHRYAGDLFARQLETSDSPTNLSGCDRKVVYLSRSRLPRSLRHIAGETFIEEELAKRGVIIAHPESMTIVEQAKLFAEADVVVGAHGSAFHTSLLAGSGKEHIYLSAEWSASNQTLIDSIMGSRSTFVRLLRSTYSNNLRPSADTLKALCKLLDSPAAMRDEL